MAVLIVIGALAVVIGVSWASRTLVNALFRPVEKAVRNRGVDSESERIRQQIQAQRRGHDQ